MGGGVLCGLGSWGGGDVGVVWVGEYVGVGMWAHARARARV